MPKSLNLKVEDIVKDEKRGFFITFPHLNIFFTTTTCNLQNKLLYYVLRIKRMDETQKNKDKKL